MKKIEKRGISKFRRFRKLHEELVLISDTHFDRNHESLRVWSAQLYADFDDICYQHRLKLRKPVIRILDLKGSWGSWDPNTRAITISRNLIESYSWDAVLEVLKHEIAHMIVNEQMDIPDHTHGDHFKQACHQIGIAGWAQASESDMASRVPGETSRSEDQNRLIKKAEKLLALAQSSNENEALLAMQKVRELYSRYNLDRIG